jgi:16S rRNA (guanine966-N2)-methyltransferase
MHIIGGKLKNHAVIAPKGMHTRPTSSKLRQTLFNICQHYVEGVHFLDLFAGSGAMGLEALSRGAADSTFIDNDRNSIKAIQQNLASMSLAGKVLSGNVFSWLERLARDNKRYGIIYADPPYDTSIQTGPNIISYSQKLLDILDELPLLEENGMLFIEDSAKFNPDSRLLNSLQLVSSRQAGRSTLLQFRRLTN